MSINSIAGAVNAYKQAINQKSGNGLDPRTDSAGAGDFAGMVREAATSATEAVSAGEKATIQAMTGGAELTDVITAVSNAELTLQTVVAVRDRVIQAYQEIIRMPI